MNDQSRAEQLGVHPGDVVWVLGHSDEENALLDPVGSGVEIVDDETVTEDDFDAAAAIVVVDDAVTLADDLDEALPRVTGVDLVWIAVPRRSRGVDAGRVEQIMTDYGWTARDRIDLDDTWSAVRVELA